MSAKDKVKNAKTAKVEVEKKETKAKASKKSEAKGDKENKPVALSNIREGKVYFREGTTARFITDLYVKYHGEKEPARKQWDKAVEEKKVESNNPVYRFNRIWGEILKRKEAGFTVA